MSVPLPLFRLRRVGEIGQMSTPRIGMIVGVEFFHSRR
jgi:hypothetical protein